MEYDHVVDALFAANNELARLARENARQLRELEEAVAARDRAEWALRKIGEVLPICVTCRAVSTDHGWNDIADFMIESGVPLSHGYCPHCARLALEEAGIATLEG
jgi:hypothetical protein